MKKLYLLCFLCTSILVLLACDNNASKEKEEIMIGAIYPKTGPLALLGAESLRGAEVAVDEINAKGGINGKKIKLVSTDAGDPNAASIEATRLITKENITLLVGSFSSSISMPASEVAQRNGALYVELGAVADPITERGYESVLRVNPRSSDGIVVQFEFLEKVIAKKLNKHLKDIRLGLMYEDSAFGTTGTELFLKRAKKEGLNIVSNQSYSATSNDLSSVILNLKKSKPDVVIATSYIADAILLTKQAKELGYDYPLFFPAGGGFVLPDYEKAVGELANGQFNTVLPEINLNKDFTVGLENFKKLYEKKFKKEAQSGYSLANYVGMKVVFEAIEKAKSSDAKKVRAAAMKIDIPKGKTANGWGVKFDEKTGQNTRSDIYITEWIDGELLTVYPKEVAVSEIIWVK
ncbi:ABC transporter substrate-binding protein [Kurthia sibirica]|nr:ABC transporter substrate-binding protein [Kurthia sibirica]